MTRPTAQPRPHSLRNPPHSLRNLGKSKEKYSNRFRLKHLAMNNVMKPFVGYWEDNWNFLLFPSSA